MWESSDKENNNLGKYFCQFYFHPELTESGESRENGTYLLYSFLFSLRQRWVYLVCIFIPFFFFYHTYFVSASRSSKESEFLVLVTYGDYGRKQ